MTYDPDMKRVEEKLDYVVNKAKHSTKENKTMSPADIMALMQSNKGMDLPGILALCQKNGADTSGQNMWWIILLFLFIGRDGGGGLFGGDRAAAASALGGAENLQIVTSLYDRIAAGTTATTTGFSNLSTQLCEAISNTIAAVNNQSDRVYDAVRNSMDATLSGVRTVGDTVRECCCKMEANFQRVLCAVEGVGAKVDLAQERNQNALLQMENRLSMQAERNQAETDKQFCALNNKMDRDRLEAENTRLRAVIARQDDKIVAAETSAAVTSDIKAFLSTHYCPTRTCS